MDPTKKSGFSYRFRVDNQNEQVDVTIVQNEDNQIVKVVTAQEFTRKDTSELTSETGELHS
ncbi:MAG: hypothetical protein DWQ07_05025 [Chloroflexi bacterium]|nr:MAG: hypothetical protein DWQ07_05025 [Chloroflexota bacterium]MBL1194795.1 hypothetical protein [Chloroflexota bacterium]NOH12087.1 hypothetical protein [Chloroflexota bacterium]